MGWFDEQIRERIQSDQEIFEDSVFEMASVVLGKGGSGRKADSQRLTKNAMDDILKYYRYKPVDIPENIKDPEEQLEYCLRPYGLMQRNISLEEKWYKDSFGPIMAFRKEDGIPVAFLPRGSVGYWYTDPDTGKREMVNESTAGLFDKEAICFYKAFPLKKLGIPDLILYLTNCLNGSDYALVVLLTLTATLAGKFVPRLTSLLSGLVLESRSNSLWLGTSLFLFSVLLSMRIINTLKALAMNRIGVKTSLSVEAAMMMRLMSLPAGFFRKYSSGELSSRMSSVNQLCVLLTDSALSVGLTSLMSLVYITDIFQYARELVIPSLIVIISTTVISVVVSLMQMRITKHTMEYSAKENGISFALISGIQKIKLAGAEKRAFSRWARSYSKAARYLYDPPMFLKISSVITSAVSLTGTIVLYYMAVRSGVTPSAYLSFNVAYGMVMGAFAQMAQMALSVANIKPILDMAKPILEEEPETAENRQSVTSLSGGIELSNISFRYKDSMPYVIQNLNLKIRAGEYIAIVGSTGCGKSTLMRLLLGFESPQKGAIYYDGKDISHLDLRSLRRKIGAVTQDGTLFQGDIYSNIVISAPSLTLEEAWEAAEIAGIAQDIREMPMGMHSIISEGQGGISGGQKQRLMIARAVAPKPKILMLDEATSALDNRTQKQVSDALDKLNCTRIVIAHRLSTIKNCDRIVVLDQGKIREDGTYDELLAKGGLFAELVERQRLDIS